MPENSALRASANEIIHNFCTKQQFGFRSFISLLPSWQFTNAENAEKNAIANTSFFIDYAKSPVEYQLDVPGDDVDIALASGDIDIKDISGTITGDDTEITLNFPDCSASPRGKDIIKVFFSHITENFRLISFTIAPDHVVIVTNIATTKINY